MKRLLLLFVFIPTLLFAQKPQDLTHDKSGYVDDYANIYTPLQKQQLGIIIRNFFDTVEIAVVTVKSLEGNDVQDVATTLFNKWGVGSKSNNGLLLLIAPTERKAFAATGRAIQGDLTDLQCAKLQRDIMVPEFKKGDYFTGTKNLLNAYIARLSPSAKQFQKDQEAAAKAQSDKQSSDTMQNVTIAFISIIILVFFVLVLRTIYNRREQLRKRKEREDNDTKMECDSLKAKIGSFHSLLLSCSGFEEYPDLMGLINLVYSIKIGDDKAYILAAKQFFEENKIAIAQLKAKKEIMDNGSNALGKVTPSYFDKIYVIIEQIKKDLAGLIFDKVDYTKDVSRLTELVDVISTQKDTLAKNLEAKQFDVIAATMRLLDSTKAMFNSDVEHLQGVISVDKKRQSDAANGMNTILGKFEVLKSYTKKKGISDKAIEQTNKGIESARAKLNNWDGLSLTEKWVLYSLIIAELANLSMAKNESDEIDRKDREEKARLAQIAETARRKREQDEEDERRRTAYITAAIISSSSSSSSYDSGSSSSFSSSDSGSSGSDFGGGSSDGGGGGSDW